MTNGETVEVHYDNSVTRTACDAGLSSAEIATRLWLSEGTVRNRVSEMLGKLGVRNRAEAVLLARENGWL